MPLFTEAVSLHSALPPDVLLDRIRGFAAGTVTIPRRSRWRSPARWWLREQPDGIHLMPLFPPTYRARQPSFIGTIDPVGSGSGVKGRIQPSGLAVGTTAFLVFMIGAMSTAGVAQELSRHSPSTAAQLALVGIGIGGAGVAMLRFSVWFAGTAIRELLETAASSDSRSFEERTIQSGGATESVTRPRSARRSAVLRWAAAIDLLIALLLIITPVLSSRVGRVVTFLIAAVLASGAAVMFVLANRLSKWSESQPPPS